MNPRSRLLQGPDGTHAPTLLKRNFALTPLQLSPTVPALAIKPLHLQQHGTGRVELPRIRQHRPDDRGARGPRRIPTRGPAHQADPQIRPRSKSNRNSINAMLRTAMNGSGEFATLQEEFPFQATDAPDRSNTPDLPAQTWADQEDRRDYFNGGQLIPIASTRTTTTASGPASACCVSRRRNPFTPSFHMDTTTR